MRFPRFRLTVRLLMTIVATAALAMAGYVWTELTRLSEGYREGDRYHADRERDTRELLLNHLACVEKFPGDEHPRLLLRLDGLRLEYHAEMRRRYRRAADRPWEPAPADPGTPIDERLEPKLGEFFTTFPERIVVSPEDQATVESKP